MLQKQSLICFNISLNVQHLDKTNNNITKEQKWSYTIVYQKENEVLLYAEWDSLSTIYCR